MDSNIWNHQGAAKSDDAYVYHLSLCRQRITSIMDNDQTNPVSFVYCLNHRLALSHQLSHFVFRPCLIYQLRVSKNTLYDIHRTADLCGS